VTKPNAKLQGDESPEPDGSDDIALVSFLRSNKPPVPEPGLGLENQLMQAILLESSGMCSGHQQSRPQTRLRRSVVISMGLCVGAIALGLGQLHQWLTPPGLSSAELAQMESFMVNNWDETGPSSETLKDWDLLDGNVTPVSPADAPKRDSNPSLSDSSQS
jgi:hypothetical protein